jgi:hypothetical protein
MKSTRIESQTILGLQEDKWLLFGWRVVSLGGLEKCRGNSWWRTSRGRWGQTRLVGRKSEPCEPVELPVQVEPTFDAGKIGQHPTRNRPKPYIEGLEGASRFGLQRPDFSLGCVGHPFTGLTKPVPHLELTLRQSQRLVGAKQYRGQRPKK